MRASRAKKPIETIQENTVNAPEFTEPVATDETPNFNDVDVDVDAPQEAPPASEDTVAVADNTVAEGDKPAKAAKESTRPPVPEGKVSPVHFAKLLTAHLIKEGRLEEGKSVAPQVVYSYIKNNGPESKNPFPFDKSEGRAAVIEPSAGIAWWDAKDERVKASKAAAAEKATKKAEKTKTGGTEGAPAEVAEQPPVVEAE
jgi:hypothetical protein